MIDDEYDVDPDQPSDHPDAPASPFDHESEDVEEDYEDIEAWLLMTVGQFEHRWDKAWIEWRRSHNLTDDDAGEMCHYPYDDEGVMLPEMTKWNEIFDGMKTGVEKEFGVKIIVDDDGAVFAQHTLADGDTVTVP